MKFLEQKESQHQKKLCGDVRAVNTVAVPTHNNLFCVSTSAYRSLFFHIFCYVLMNGWKE